MTIPELAVILMLAFRAAAQDYGHSRDFTPASYRILDAGLFGSLQKKADDASIGGYDVAAGFERVVVMRRARAGERSVTTTVMYASPVRREIEWVEQRLNDAAAAGFRLVPNAMLTSLHLAVMEKRRRRQLIVFFEKSLGAPVITPVAATCWPPALRQIASYGAGKHLPRRKPRSSRKALNAATWRQPDELHWP